MTLRPLTFTPLLLERSFTNQNPSINVNSQCAPEMFENLRTTSQFSLRPTTIEGFKSGMGSPPAHGCISPYIEDTLLTRSSCSVHKVSPALRGKHPSSSPVFLIVSTIRNALKGWKEAFLQRIFTLFGNRILNTNLMGIDGKNPCRVALKTSCIDRAAKLDKVVTGLVRSGPGDRRSILCEYPFGETPQNRREESPGSIGRSGG